MAEINWNLLGGGVDTGAQVQQGFATGMALVKQIQTKNALRAYLANPDDAGAYNALAFYDPQAAASIQQQQLTKRKLDLETQQLARRRQVGGMVASGDLPGARATAYGAGDFDLGKSIDDAVEALGKQGKEATDRAAAKYQALAPLAYQASKLPYDKRKEFLAANQDLLTAAGVTPEEAANFDPTDVRLAGIVGFGSKLSELVSADKPQVVPYTQGGGVALYQGGKVSTLIQPQTDPNGPPAGTPVGSQGGSSRITAKNNPGALRKPGSKEFQSFANEGEGIKAQEAQIGRYLDRGLNSVSSIVETYAPRMSKGGDNTDEQVNNYIGYVAQRLGVSPQDALSPAMAPKIAAAMREFETGHREKAAAHVATDKIRAAANRAIAAGADPEKVRARAAEQGVML